MQPCDPLPNFTGKDTDSTFNYLVQAIELYHDCSARHTALAAWLKK